MAKVNFKVKGGKALRDALSSMSAEVQAEAGKAVLGSAVELRSDVVKAVHSGPASGRVYKKSNPNRTHQASAPGQAPQTDTGRLASSIFFDKVGDLTAVVGSSVIYALYLEYGTSRMAARPFFRPAVERMKPKFQRRLELAIERATS